MKKVLTYALTLIAVVTLTIAGTVAYLTDQDSKVNVFTVGNVDIEVVEDFVQDSELLPGVDVNKDVQIKNIGKNEAWVWYAYAIPSALDSDDASHNVIHVNHAGANWYGYENDQKYWEDGQTAPTPIDQLWLVDKHVIKDGYTDDAGIKYNVYVALYNGKLLKDQTTTVGMTNVYLDKHVDIHPDGNWYKVVDGVATTINWNTNINGAPKIHVAGFAMQTEGFDNVEQAYDAYVQQWGGLNLDF